MTNLVGRRCTVDTSNMNPQTMSVEIAAIVYEIVALAYDPNGARWCALVLPVVPAKYKLATTVGTAMQIDMRRLTVVEES